MYDVIVIGGGAAGLTAAIYTSRKSLKTLILSMDIGGQTNLTSCIENYPGVDPCHGAVLMKKFEEQAKSFGAKIVAGKVLEVKKWGEKHFSAKLASNEIFESHAVILAFGKVPKSLEIKGEDKFYGRGISTSVASDAHLFKNKTVAMIGGGNSAVEGAFQLSRLAKKVYLIHRRDAFTADELNVARLKKMRNVEIILNTVAVEAKGDKKIKSVIIEDVNARNQKKLAIDGLFVEIGLMVDPSMIKKLVKLNEKNEIIIDERCNTSCSGVFAAGDATTVLFKQTVISAGEGAKAGLEAYRYISGGKGVGIDWTKSKNETKRKI